MSGNEIETEKLQKKYNMLKYSIVWQKLNESSGESLPRSFGGQFNIQFFEPQPVAAANGVLQLTNSPITNH